MKALKVSSFLIVWLLTSTVIAQQVIGVKEIMSNMVCQLSSAEIESKNKELFNAQVLVEGLEGSLLMVKKDIQDRLLEATVQRDNIYRAIQSKTEVRPVKVRLEIDIENKRIIYVRTDTGETNEIEKIITTNTITQIEKP